MASIIELAYGQPGTFRINLLDNAGLLFDNAISLVAGDFNGQTDSGTVGALATLPVATGLGYTVALSAAELTGQTFNIQGESANFWNNSWVVETTGNPLAKHPYRDRKLGLVEGLIAGAPTLSAGVAVIPTTINGGAAAGAAIGDIVRWGGVAVGALSASGTLTAHTTGANSTLTITTSTTQVPAVGDVIFF